MFCQIIVTKSDISDRIIKRERVNTLDIQLDDYEQDRKISWNADTFVDKYNASYAGTHKICQSTGFVWQSQIIGLIWSDIEANWEPQFVSCLKAGLTHKGFIYYKDKQADPLTKYFSPYHPVFTEINKACGELTLKKLEKNYKCTTNLGASICNDRLMVMRNGKPNLLSLNEAVVVKLNGEEVGTVGQETEQGVTERLARENEARRKADEAEKRQAWLASAEGKNWTAQQQAIARSQEEERLKNEAVKLAQAEKLRAEERAKKELITRQCENMKKWGADSRELIGRALKVSASSITLLRFSMGQMSCLAIVDTPKGPEKCKVENIIQDKKSGEYFADLGGVTGIQATCGGWAF